MELQSRSKTNQLWLQYQATVCEVLHHAGSSRMFGKNGSSNLKAQRTLQYIGQENYNAKSFVHSEILVTYIIFYQILLSQSLLPNYGLGGYWWWYGCSRMGIEIYNNQMILIVEDMKAAPDNLLEKIHCNCKLCPPHCSCLRYGLPCHAGCWPCQTGTCVNPYSNHIITDDDIDASLVLLYPCAFFTLIMSRVIHDDIVWTLYACLVYPNIYI